MLFCPNGGFLFDRKMKIYKKKKKSTVFAKDVSNQQDAVEDADSLPRQLHPLPSAYKHLHAHIYGWTEGTEIKNFYKVTRFWNIIMTINPSNQLLTNELNQKNSSCHFTLWADS